MKVDGDQTRDVLVEYGSYDARLSEYELQDEIEALGRFLKSVITIESLRLLKFEGFLK